MSRTKRLPKQLNKKHIPLAIALVIVIVQLAIDLYNAIDTELWYHENYDTDGTLLNIIGDVIDSFFSEVILNLFSGMFIVVPLLVLICYGVLFINHLIKRFAEHRHSDPADAASLKDRIMTTIFVLSFLPPVYLIGASVISMSEGVSTGLFSAYRVYGLEAFMNTFVWIGLAMCTIPIFPAMLIYQTIYIIHRVNTRSE